jgi:hypothetical protein
MAGTSLENFYGFGPKVYGAKSSGGLLRVLEEAMHERDLRTGNDYLAGGLYGRMLALKREQESLGLGPDRRQAPQRSFDPNFRQLVRMSTTVQPQGASRGSSNSEYQSNADSLVARLPGQDSGASELPLDRPAPVLAGLRLFGRKAPPLPVGVGAIPSSPVPRVPETWDSSWPLLRILPEIMRGLAAGEKFGSDENANREVDGGRPTVLPRTTQERDTQAPPNALSPETPGGMPPNNDRGPQGGIFGLPLWLDHRQRQSSSTDDRRSEQRDPNFRELSRIPSRTSGSEASEGSGAYLPQPITDEWQPSNRFEPPRSYDDLDIPDFLRRRPPAEATTSSLEKPLNDPPQTARNGNGNWGNGNGRGGGGGGGGDGYDEECDKQWKRAHEICVDAYSNGTIGDRIKRWRSDYATGPFSKPFGGQWSIPDCKKGLVDEECGGGVYERPPEPAVRWERAKKELARRRKR